MQLSFKTKTLNFFRRIFLFTFFEKILLLFSPIDSINKIVSKFIPSHYLYPNPSSRKFVRNGIRYDLDISRFNDWSIYWSIFTENSEKRALYKLIKKGDLVIDIGANIGEVTLNMAHKTGEKGRVISFEPYPETYDLLMKQIMANEFKNITAENLGLGNTESELLMRPVNKSNPGMNKIVSDFTGEERKVKVMRLDDYIKERNIGTVDVMKLDVEGYEYNVLEGSAELLKKYKPLLFIELDDEAQREQGHSAAKLIQFLNQVGYSNIVNLKTGEPVTPLSEFKNCHFDIVCYKG